MIGAKKPVISFSFDESSEGGNFVLTLLSCKKKIWNGESRIV